MDPKQLSERLRSLLKERFPGNYNYTPLLAELLGLHEKTILSKLRGATQFTAEELYIIADTLDVAVGELFNKTYQPDKHPMDLYIHDFTVHTEQQKVVSKTMDAFRLASSSAHSTYYVASNKLPDLFFTEHENIARFVYIRWLYFNKGREEAIPFSDIRISPEDEAVHREYAGCIHSFKKSFYILHINMMQFVAEEVLFFYNIRLLTKEDVHLLISDYYEVLREFEQICNGELTRWGKTEVHVFFSHLLLANDITVIESDELNLGILYTYFQNPIVTPEYRTFQIVKKWFHSLLYSSNLISVSDPIHRVEFFQRQRNFLATLEQKVGA